jgi:porin
MKTFIFRSMLHCLAILAVASGLSVDFDTENTAHGQLAPLFHCVQAPCDSPCDLHPSLSCAGDACLACSACDRMGSEESGCDTLGCCCGARSGCHDFWSRPTLLGDWLGVRPALGQHGIMAQADLTHFYQGVASGGNEQVFRYGAKMNLMLMGDTEKMGLWKGGKVIFHAAEWQFGENIIADAVGLAPANTNLLLPQPSPSFAITHLQYIQGLTESGWVATFGRYNLIDLWTSFYPDYGRGLDGFMNVASLIPINAVAPGLPPVSNIAGILKEGEGGPEAAFLVIESQSSPTTVGLDFPNGVTLLGALRRNTKIGNRAGSHMLAATYSTGDYTSFDTNDWVILPGGIVAPGS